VWSNIQKLFAVYIADVYVHDTDMQLIDFEKVESRICKYLGFQTTKQLRWVSCTTPFVFPFVYQFQSRIEALICSSFANGFQHRFKICLLWLLHEKECSFYTYLFYCTEMRWLFISSRAIWVTGSDTGSVASRARSELTRWKCEWTRIELSRM
jgi:hypothetical protein